MGVAAPVGLSFALLVDVLAWVIVAALLIIWRNTFGKALLYIANLLSFHVHIPHVWDHTFNLGKPFAEAEHGITTWLKAEKVGLEIEIAWTWHALGEIWHKTARMLEWAVDETVGAFERLEHVKVPQWAKWAAAAALPSALFAKIVAAVVARIQPIIHKGTTVVTNTFPTKVVTIVRKMAAGAATLPGWVIHIPRELRDIKSDIRGIRKSLRHPATFLGAAVMAGLIANVLGVATRCVRRGNIGKTARRICGMDPSLLDSLLIDGLAILGAVSVVEFAKDLQAIEDEAISVLGAMIHEWPS